MCRFTIVATVVLLNSCSNSFEKPTESVSTSLPTNWKEAGEGNDGKISTAWLTEFNSSVMTKLVHEAIANNPNLKAAESNLRASWAITSVANANLKPSVNFNSGATRRRNSGGGSSASYDIGTNASWELDLWGELQDRVDAERADYKAEAHELRNARLSLAANTAQAWCNLITAEQQLELASTTLASFKKNNTIVERNYKAGIPGTTSLAVQLSRSNVASAKSTLRNNKLQRNNAARALELLLGRYPSAEVKSSKTLPRIKRSTPTGFPATLLARRPDVAAAQLDVYSSAKIAEASRKNLLPIIRLSSGVSSGGSIWKDVFNPSTLAANAAASLTQTLYDGGQLEASAQAALENNKASIHRYTNIVLAAANEIEEAIATDRSLQDREQFLIEQTKSSTLAESQATRDYSEGIDGVGILEILESQRRANDARSNLIDIRNSRLQNRIDLHLALGGDYSTTIK